MALPIGRRIVLLREMLSIRLRRSGRALLETARSFPFTSTTHTLKVGA